MPRTSKPKQRTPTTEEFLTYRPRRLDFLWTTDEHDLVHITVPKFHSAIGKKFCKLLRRENTITANMDELGSLVWKHCDGRKTIGEILTIIEKEFSDQENLDQRLFLFIQQMGQLRYLTY